MALLSALFSLSSIIQIAGSSGTVDALAASALPRDGTSSSVIML